ncbi:hypothetical protein SteCoe_14580 [Stentor coeruleus]|uniref:Oxysterol-binding protein n=1 Tax=Stentor coeruleus TaxID=5963 RepID=A0A1R2C5P8_9CILI|nr:hypothetical protein SteCoe_14580 [Stentor coeruleus]
MDSESDLSHPMQLSPNQVKELFQKLQDFLSETESTIPNDDQSSQLPDEFLRLYNQLDESKKNFYNDSVSSLLPPGNSPECLMLNQRIIEIALNWKPIPEKDDYRVQEASSYGGLALQDAVVLSKIRSVATEILKQLGRKIISGDFNLTQTSFPIRCMQASTSLHNILDTFRMIPLYITRAVATKDRLERFKLTIVSVLSSFLFTSTFEKPLNPILGETQQAVLEDGTRMFSEQSSHHPPVSHFYIDGSGYKAHGYFNFSASAGLNSVTVTSQGKRIFQFYDGYTVMLSCPEELFSGTFFGTMRHETLGSMAATDTEGHNCLIAFSKVRGKPSDYVQGTIKNLQGKELSKLEGTYLGYLEFSGVRYWDARYIKPYKITYPQLLLSDSECRKDMCVLKTGDIERAQAAKEELENIQRNDRKLRSIYSK